MKKFSYSKILIYIMAIVIVILLVVCLYFYKQSKTLDDSMFIGTPININQINYSDVIRSKDDFRTIQQALISSVSIDKPSISNDLPNANIRIDDSKQGICYLFADVWFDNYKVIFALGGKDFKDAEYKEVSEDFGKVVIECISKYKED
jgi:hypothetical protein